MAKNTWYRWKTFEDKGGKLIEWETGYFNKDDAVGDATISLQGKGKIAYVELVFNDGQDVDDVLTLSKNNSGEVVEEDN
jgi:hypothetical protein